MLNFINSLVLPLVAAALIPLLLNLLNRKKLRVVPFSSLRFLKELQNKRLRQIKLYQILILIVRMLFIIFLVLAFARPAVRYFWGAKGSNARTTAVIILDDSYSMQTQQGMESYFDLAGQSLQTILKSFTKKDKKTVILPLTDSLLQIDISEEKPLPVSRIKVTNYTPNFSRAFLQAKEIFERFPNYNRELYIISDGLISDKALDDSAQHVLNRLPARIFFVNVANEGFSDNMSIDSAAVQTRLIELQKPVTVTAIIENHTPETKQITVSLFDGSARLAMQLVNVPGQSKRQVALHFSPGHTGFFPLKLEIDDDDLLADNTYYLSLFIPEAVPVLYVQNQTPTELRAALNTLSAKTNLKIKQSDYDRWYGEALSDYQLLILNDPPQITPTFLQHIKQFLNAGHDVILIPGTHLTPADYNRLSTDLFGKNIFQELVKTSAPDQFFAPQITPLGNVLLSDLFQQKPEKIKWPPFFQYFKMGTIGKNLMRFSNGDPFLAKISVQKTSHLWLFSAGLTFPWSRFPISGLFIPFLHRIFSLASNNEQINTHFIVGQPFSVYLNKSVMHGNVQLAPPEGQPLTIIPRQTARGLRFDFDGFARPGHYKILQGSRTIQLFAVNLSSLEWAKPFIDFKSLRKDLQLLTPKTLSVKTLKNTRTGKELWPFLLALALLMLFLEMFLIKKLE